MKTEGGTCPVLKQVAFIMRLYDNSVPWSCVYIKLSGNFGITVQKYPHTQQHIIHKAPRLYILIRYIARGASNVLSSCCLEIGDFLNMDNA